MRVYLSKINVKKKYEELNNYEIISARKDVYYDYPESGLIILEPSYS